MAAYREHISVSGLLGVAYGLLATFALGFTPVQAGLCGTLTWVAGMLPDLDSQTGKPVRELFSLIAAVVPIVMFRRLFEWGYNEEGAMLLAVLLYASIRYGAAWFLGMVSVHRGMFHSVPALLIASEATFLAYKSDYVSVKVLMAGGVALGFFSHLLLDELYSVQWTGVRIRLNKAAGSAIKMFGKSLSANAVTYGILAATTWLALVDVGFIVDPATVQNREYDSPVEGVPMELDEAGRHFFESASGDGNDRM